MLSINQKYTHGHILESHLGSYPAATTQSIWQESLNRTIIGLKDVYLGLGYEVELEFESNYYRIERDLFLDLVLVLGFVEYEFEYLGLPIEQSFRIILLNPISYSSMASCNKFGYGLGSIS